MPYKVSIVIPLFNCESYIERAIKSVLSQTEQNFEIIIIDDGSKDDSYNIVRKYQNDRIRVYKQVHLGVSKARNFGVEKSKSEFIAFLDSDDVWLKSHLNNIFELNKKYPKAGFYFTNNIFNSAGKNKITHEYNSSINKDNLIMNLFKYILKGDLFISTSSVCLNKNIFKEMNGFTEAKWGEDQDLWDRIALKYPIAYSPIKSVIIERGSNGIDRLQKRMLVTPEHPFIISGKKALANGVPDFLRNDLTEVIALYQIKSADYQMQLGNFEAAKKIINNCDTNKFKWHKKYLSLWTNFPFSNLGIKSYNSIRAAITLFNNVLIRN